MMITYGPVRYVCELLRDNEKIFPSLSAVGVHAVIITVVGLAWLYILYKKENKAKGQRGKSV